MPQKPKSPIPIEQIDEMIRTIRGVRVPVSSRPAKIYGGQRASFNPGKVPKKRPFLIFPSAFSLFCRAKNKKAAEAFLRPAAFG